MLHQQQADAVREERRVLAQGGVRVEPQFLQRLFAGSQGLVEMVVQLVVEFAGQAARAHALHKIEAQVQVARVRRVEVEPRLGSRRERLAGAVLRHRGVGYGGLQPLDRLVEQGRVDRLLALEVRIDGTRRVAGPPGDFAHARALDAGFQKDRTGGIEHEHTAGIAERLAALDLGFHWPKYSLRLIEHPIF